ncbi:MAG: glutamate synthase [Comamonadaceae bacterium]|nr:glutamate synthase [Comamonadaceae bacterium]
MCNRGQLDEAVGINSVERFLGDEALRRGWALRRPAAVHRQARAGRRRRALGAVGGLPPAPPRPRASTVAEAGRVAGGMMRFGIPKYRLPRDVLDAESRSASSTLGVELRLNTKRRPTSRERMQAGGFDAAFLAVGAHIAKRSLHPGRRLGADSRRRRGAALDGGRRTSRCSAAASSSTAAATPRSTSRAPPSAWAPPRPIIVYRRTRERMPAHDFEVEEALEEGVHGQVAVDDQAGRRPASLTIEKMRLDAKRQAAADRRVRDAGGRLAGAGAGPGRRPVAARRRAGAGGHATAWSRSTRATMMTGHPGLFAGGDMVPGRAQRHGGDRPRQEGRAPHRRLAARRRRWRNRPSTRPASFERLNPWYYADAPKTVRPQLELARRTDGFDEVQHGLTEDNALFEARRCLSCGNCFECDNCYGVCPDNAVIKLGAGQRYADQLRLLQGLRPLRCRVPLRGDRHGRRGETDRPDLSRPSSPGRPPRGAASVFADAESSPALAGEPGQRTAGSVRNGRRGP